MYGIKMPAGLVGSTLAPQTDYSTDIDMIIEYELAAVFCLLLCTRKIHIILI